MYLDLIKKKNPKLLEVALDLHQQGEILPDSYIVDIDQLVNNATTLLNNAKINNIDLYFMLKQLGRNPYIAKKLVEIGYQGAVVVDFKEALVMMEHNIPLSNVGNLVQIPVQLMKRIMSYKTEYITVFSFETLNNIDKIAKELGIIQKVMLRVYDDNDLVYSGQEAGIHLNELNEFIKQAKMYSNIDIGAVTSFPCYLYSEEANDLLPKENLNTVLKAAAVLEENGIIVNNINAPSSTCSYILPKMNDVGVTSAEPGHGLTGTTPAHLHLNLEEKPCVVYVSEISHNFKGKGYCYGGGHYRRSHVKNAFVGNNFKHTEVIPPNCDSIDYYFGLSDTFNIGETVLMGFRYQMFVTRSTVVLVEGIQSGNPSIVGIYDSQGTVKWTSGLY